MAENLTKKEKFVIIKDSREQTGWSFPETDVCRGYVKKKVDYGDYTIEGMEHLLMIERKKSTGEIAQNVTEKRFEKLLNYCKGFKHKFMIMEFSIEDILDFPNNSGMPRVMYGKTRVTPQFMLSYLTDVQIKSGIHIIYAGNAECAERIAYEIMRKIYSLYKKTDV